MKLYKLFMILSTIFSPYSLLYAFLPVFFFFLFALFLFFLVIHILSPFYKHILSISIRQIFPLLSRFIHNSTTPIKNTVSYFKKNLFLKDNIKKMKSNAVFY